MNQNLGRKLRAARKAAGLSTRSAAMELARYGVSLCHATIANYENAKTVPPLTTVTALAGIYRRDVNWFLLRGPALTDVQFRSLRSVGVRQRQAFVAEAERWLAAYRSLEHEVGTPFNSRMQDFHVGVAESGVLAASRLRERLELGDRPVPSVMAVLQDFGVRVIEITTDARIDAIAARVEGDGEKVVVLASHISPDRLRLTAAHELGHHLFHVAQARASAEPEKRAFEFGSQFLIPPAALDAAFRSYSMIRLLEYKQRYGVSLAAMVYRAKEAALLDDRTYEWLWRVFTKRGWRKREPGLVRPDRPSRFEEILESATGSGRLSWAKASRITGISERELRNRVSSMLALRDDWKGG